ncbi:MAG TPA: hypothetical protein VLN45_07730 [Ignavibacteriaceae bacterium]|nr:hypothetical protein [Ignavibacteriaceae bacterium]
MNKILGAEDELTKKALASVIDLYKTMGKTERVNYYSQLINK